jgi:hypothetical protein
MKALNRAEVEDLPIYQHYRRMGRSDRCVYVAVEALHEAMNGLPADLDPSEPLTNHIEYSTVDSEFDWFWIGTVTRLARLFQEKDATVEQRLNALEPSKVETFDDYFDLIFRYLDRLAAENRTP